MKTSTFLPTLSGVFLSGILSNIKCSVIVEELKNLENVFSDVQKEHDKMTKVCAFLKEETHKLWSDFNEVAAQVKDLQQLTRVDNVEISGIPQEPAEDIYDILTKVCTSIGIDFNRGEISEAHRLPSKQGPPYIIVRFTSRMFRDRWLSAARTRTGDVQHIYPHQPSAPFYINQHLTSYKKGLLDMAKRLVSERVYKFAWAKDGRVYVRKSTNGKLIRIRTFEDFDQPAFQSPPQVQHNVQ